MQHRGEPSVEEILESIKKVIDRENRQTMQTERRRRETEGVRSGEGAGHQSGAFDPANDAADEVLDLGAAATTLEDDPPETDPPAARKPAAAEPAIMRAADLQSDREPEMQGTRGREDSLITDDAAASMRQSLAALTMLTRPAASGGDATSLEAMARDMLRPMLADWLDQHLPEMVERLVKAEIARIAGIDR